VAVAGTGNAPLKLKARRRSGTAAPKLKVVSG
jgi:hypothetical protein